MTKIIRSLLVAFPCCCVVLTGCGVKAPPAPYADAKPSKDPRRMTASELQEFVSTNVSMAGIEKATASTQLPTEPLRPEVPVVQGAITTPKMTVPIMTMVPEKKTKNTGVVFSIPNVRSTKPHTNESDAKYDALLLASVKINDKLQSLDSPIVVSMKPSRVYGEYLVKGSERKVALTDKEREMLKDSPAGDDRFYYEFDVEVTETQIQALRSEGRMAVAGGLTVGLLIFAGIINLFLRLTGSLKK